MGKEMKEAMYSKLSRRGFLRASGVAVGGMALGGAVACTGIGKTPTPQQCGYNLKVWCK